MPLRPAARRALWIFAALVLVAGALRLGRMLLRHPSRFVGGPPPIVRGPLLGQVTTTSALVAWNTDPAVRGSVEVLGETALVFGGGEPATVHRVRVTGLAPGTRYRYRVRCDGEATGEEHALATAPATPAPFKLVVLGDSGGGSPEQAHIAAQMLAEEPTFVIHTGDMVYPHGDPYDYDRTFFHPYRALLDHVPFHVTLGNHDVEGPNRGRTFLEELPLPRNDRTNTAEFYSWDWSNGHFVALDTELTFSEGSAQLEWLKEDLARSTATWKVAFFHHPPYASFSGGETGVKAKLCPLFEKHGVDLVLSGHDHLYERTFPIVQAQPVGATADPDYVNPPGPIYVVTGGGGKSLYESRRSAFTAVSRSVFHYLRVEVAGDTLTLSPIAADGKPFDRMSIRKPR